MSAHIAGWSSLVARRAHNPEAVGSNPAPATNYDAGSVLMQHRPCCFIGDLNHREALEHVFVHDQVKRAVLFIEDGIRSSVGESALLIQPLAALVVGEGVQAKRTQAILT